jgi:hypothetical protein
MIKEETYGIIWGTVLLVIGLIILLAIFSSVFDIAQNPSARLEQWAPEKIKDPTAKFSWWSDGKTVEFYDTSIEGSSEINSWKWDFGDGTTSLNRNPSYQYSTINNYTVILEVTDDNGNSHTAMTKIYLSVEEPSEGQTQTSMSMDLGIDTTLNRLIISIIILVALAILVMIGGRLLVAGCRLMRPNVQIYKMKMNSEKKDKKN